MVHIYRGILHSHKKERSNAICSNMDRPKNYYTKWSKTEKDKYHMILLIGGKSYKFICITLKSDTNELIHKTEIDSQT